MPGLRWAVWEGGFVEEQCRGWGRNASRLGRGPAGGPVLMLRGWEVKGSCQLLCSWRSSPATAVPPGPALWLVKIPPSPVSEASSKLLLQCSLSRAGVWSPQEQGPSFLAHLLIQS